MLYLATAHHHHLADYLSGLYAGCRLFGLEMNQKLLEEASSELGWEYSLAAGPYPDMVARGVTEEDCVQELLAVHILAWTKILDNHRRERHPL
jgi:hypothetical protein